MGLVFSNAIPSRKRVKKLQETALVSRKDLFALKEELRLIQLSKKGVSYTDFARVLDDLGVSSSSYARQLYAQFDVHNTGWIDAKDVAV